MRWLLPRILMMKTLGAGGTIARLVENGTDVSVLVVSGHLPPLYDEGSFDATRREAERAFKILGVKRFEFFKDTCDDGESGSCCRIKWEDQSICSGS